MSKPAETLLSALVEHLRSTARAPDGVAAPAAILWTDPEGQWRPLVPALLRALPELLVHGPFDPVQRTGPAIWLRCVVDRALSVEGLAAEAVPILYLPGTSRQALTTGEECPRDLQPLVELMYRGAAWLQKGGADWTVGAFMTSSQSLALDVARDGATRAALQRALREVAVMPLAQLRRGRLEASDFDQLLSSDVLRDLLRWMGEPDATRERMGGEAWAAFSALCQKRLDFDPEQQGHLKAGEFLALAEGPWAEAWSRFEEAPEVCVGIPALLRKCPQSLFPEAHWPARNDAHEKALASALRDLVKLPHRDACARGAALERDHAARRRRIWARLGEAPLALALERLAKLAELARQPLGGGTPREIADAYSGGAWQADAAAWQVLAAIPLEHEELLREVVQQLAQPWLEESARSFQEACERVPTSPPTDSVDPALGGCLLFVDGLRYDLGRLLGERLEGRGARAEVRSRWAALPTVTATGKPAVTPLAAEIVGTRLGEEFAPTFRDGRPVHAAGLRTALTARGYQVLSEESGDWRQGEEARAFLESGDVDALGHERQEHLPRQLEEQLVRLTDRILKLLEAGWQTVRVVTDHGWLFLPRGLPSIDLPKHLTLSRWARCAVVAGASQVGVPRVAWHWNAAESVAVAPGISCFNQSPCYAHGGLTIQECLTPDLLVARGGERYARAEIRSITWRGMRCFIEAASDAAEVRVDLRLVSATGPSVVKSTKRLEADGTASLVVSDDQYEQSALMLVLLAPDQTLLAQRETRVGNGS